MASTAEFVQYTADQLSEAGKITYRKMFGEYGLYCDGVFFAVVCDNQFFLKPTEAAMALMPSVVLQPPYPGASPLAPHRGLGGSCPAGPACSGHLCRASQKA